ncbi:hypothetical protein [Streptomyces globisporus]|uniref:hypothetical protein n=1 Tax=Streptomyces globisporus TaxID=1908 RepID=UPI0037A5EA09|nr:hypothetical protein OG449_03905 [Streptomyces globisporus]
MSELIKLVTALERRVQEAGEAQQVADRLWDATEELLREVRAIATSVSEIRFEIDGYIGENDYIAVERSAYELRGATDTGRLLPVLRQALLLVALRDGSSLPDPTSIELLPELSDTVMEHPTLSLEELLRDSKQELEAQEESLRTIWCDEDDEPELEDHLHEARLDSVRDRATRAGRQLMELCEYISEVLCPELVTSTEAGNSEVALRALAAVSAAGEEAVPAYKIYEVALSEQYERSPTSLGTMGEHLMLFEGWLNTQ